MGAASMETIAVRFLLRLFLLGVLLIAVIQNYWSLTLWETIHITTRG